MKALLSWPCACALAVVLGAAALAPAQPSRAYREKVVTPHWQWVDRHAGGTVKALFITSFLGQREAEALAQRFDIGVDVVPVRGNPSGIPTEYDTEYLAQALAAEPDVIVVPYRGAWGKLNEDATQKLVDAVSDGTPLIATSAGNAPDAFQGQPLADADARGQRFAERNLAVDRLHFDWGRKNGRMRLNISRCGDGRFINVGMGHHAGRGFNAFIPDVDQPPATSEKYEIAYAVFARLIRWAADMTTEPSGELKWQDAPTVGSPLAVTAELNESIDAVTSVEWALRSPFGDALTQGTETMAAGQTDARIALPVSQAGELTLMYRLRRDGAVTDYGAVPINVPAPLQLTGIRAPEFNAATEPVPVEWSLEGDISHLDEVLIQVFDANDRLVSWKRCAADERNARLDGWRAQGVWHRLRVLALDEDANILAEKRTPLHVQVDRSADPQRFHVMAWATESGAPQERWRYRRLRQLGITAFSPLGKDMTVPRMAARAGLRLAPVNICVPPGRFKKQFHPAEEREALKAYTKAIAPLSPLGYSLADEPAGVDLAGFRNWAADIIHQHDPGARIGYCGTHMKVGMNVPRVLSSCDFMIHYSPHYLYTSDLWRGIERDLHRSFTAKDGLNTAYTHYVPWDDHEPYSRTMPWLLLFEEANGISYFASAGGNFTILKSDLRTTHETRWWSDEIRELQRGIATQLVGMERETGDIAVLFPTNLPKALKGSARQATTRWAEALRELNVSYRFVAPGELSELNPADTPLLICPPTPVLAAEALSSAQGYVEAGGTLVAMAPFALVEPQDKKPQKPPFWKTQAAEGDPSSAFAAKDDKQASPAELLNVEPLFGIRRQSAGSRTREKRFKDLSMRSGIPATITWATQDRGAPGELEGATAGQYALAATDAEALATFSKPGKNAPAFARDALSSAAALRVRRGNGTAYYLNFVPDAGSTQKLIQWLQRSSEAASAPARVTVDGDTAPAVYLYPMVGNGVCTLGVIQDYERVEPEYQNTKKQTAIYYNHGPLRWAAQNATLKLDQPAHLYDMRRKQYLGETATADFALRPGRPELFALLPYEVTNVVTETPDTVQAGRPLTVPVRIATEAGDPGEHTVHVRLAPKDKPGEPTFAGDFKLVDGTGTVTVPTAYNDAAGEWVLRVTDALTGIETKADVRVQSSGNVGPVPPRQEVRVEKIARDWPQGEWQAYEGGDAGRREQVDVHVGSIKRKRVHYAPFDGLYCLLSKNLVRLRGRKTNFNFKYFACNDWKEKGWDDKRRVQGHSLSGLGMRRPAGHLWYANGYIDIYYDDFRVTSYRIADAKQVEAAEDGRVDVTWESPAGEAVLSFGLTLEGEALLQQLEVHPAVAVETVKVEFRSYIGGFGNSGTRYVRTAAGRGGDIKSPERAAWAFYADDVRDQAYGKGMGSGGILIRPEQWDKVHYGLRGELKKKVDLKPGETAAFQWALWVYPELTNEEAFEAFTNDRSGVKKRLRTFFKEEDR